MTDQEIHASILAGGRATEVATHYILTTHQGMMYQIKTKLNLSDSDIKDVYADAISHLIWNIKTGKFLAESQISTYLYRVFYNKSVDHLRHITTNKNAPTAEITNLSMESDENLEANSYNNIVSAQVKNEIKGMGTPCKQILIDWAYWGYSMKEIAIRNNLENGVVAKKKKYTCLQKLRAVLSAKNIH